MGKALIVLIQDIVSITGDATNDTILYFFIGLISYKITFGAVGRIFDGFVFMIQT